MNGKRYILLGKRMDDQHIYYEFTRLILFFCTQLDWLAWWAVLLPWQIPLFFWSLKFMIVVFYRRLNWTLASCVDMDAYYTSSYCEKTQSAVFLLRWNSFAKPQMHSSQLDDFTGTASYDDDDETSENFRIVWNFTKRQDRHTFKTNWQQSSISSHFWFWFKELVLNKPDINLAFDPSKSQWSNSKRMNKSSTFTHHSTNHPSNTPKTPGCLGDRVLKRSLPGYTNQLQLHGFHAAPEVRKMLVGLGVRKIPRMMCLGTGKLHWNMAFFWYLWLLFFQVVVFFVSNHTPITIPWELRIFTIPMNDFIW